MYVVVDSKCWDGEMGQSWHGVELSCGETSQIKESAHWHCFSLFINQIHHNEECVSLQGRVQEDGRVGGREERWMDGWMEG